MSGCRKHHGGCTFDEHHESKMYVVEKEMEGRQITQDVLSPLGLSVPIQRCAKPPLHGLGLRP